MSQKYLYSISKETVSRYLLFFSSYVQNFYMQIVCITIY